MSAYALAHLREIDPHPDILKYLERIQATLDPFWGGSSCTAAPSMSAKEPGRGTSSS